MGTPQRFSEFEAAERSRGCSEVIARSWEPDLVVETHTHPYNVRALVVQGEMWLTVDGATRHLQRGDRFDVLADQPHAERYGPQGATCWVARC